MDNDKLNQLRKRVAARQLGIIAEGEEFPDAFKQEAPTTKDKFLSVVKWTGYVVGSASLAVTLTVGGITIGEWLMGVLK